MWADRERLRRAAEELLAGVAVDRWGQVGVSVYETARLVTVAPWLAGHDARVDHLCQRQRPDGTWGGPEGYALVPTLAATGAVLCELTRTGSRGRRKQLARVAVQGATALYRWLAPSPPGGRGRCGPVAPAPPSYGRDLVVPALLEELQRHAATVAHDPYLADLPEPVVRRLAPPADHDRSQLARLRAEVTTGRLPQIWWSFLDLLGPRAVASPSVRPVAGTVAASPAATAAWLGGASGDPEVLGYLVDLQERGAGAVPSVAPPTILETATVLNQLAVGRLRTPVPPVLLRRLETALRPDGAPVAPGLPRDADGTAIALSALARHGRVRPPTALLAFRTDGRFARCPGERTPSVVTNAHALEALSLYLAARPDAAALATAASSVAEWLVDAQDADGSWSDMWHASPYAATTAAVLALLRHDPVRWRPAVNRAVRWVRDTQRPDGSWGRFSPTVEETAYAVQLLATAAPRGASLVAVDRGCAYLAANPEAEHPPLWVGKDLFVPLAVVRAARLAALHLAATVAAVPAPRRPVDRSAPATARQRDTGRTGSGA